MKHPLIFNARRGPPESSSGSSSFGLPADLLAAGCRRLVLAAFVYAITFVAATAVSVAVFWDHRGQPPFVLAVTGAIAGTLLALVTIAVCRRAGLSPQSIVRISSIFQVFGGLLISIVMYWGFLNEHYTLVAPNFFGLSWLCIWILIFPLIVPAPPRQALVASLITASMDPLVVAVSHAFVGFTPEIVAQLPRPMTAVLIQLFYPNYICVGMAYVGSRIIYNLGRDLSQARQMGSYSLEEKLGIGGMGEVWKATHRLLARPAAIKLIRPEILAAHPGGAEIVLKRFEREAQATARLGSPHTVELYDFGLAADGSFYYVMELLDGMDLETLVVRFGPLPPERAVHLLVQVCDSLADAHASGLVHRDIKPANIFTCRKGHRHDYAKVLDFGLARAQRPDANATRLTQEGSASGTPAYMAPEAVLGEDEMDGRADLYALGCVACWLLTGQLVFDGRTPMEIVLKHAREEPVPISRRVEYPVPPALEEAIMACLRKEPDKRPADAEALRRRLLDAGVGPWTEAQARMWWDSYAPKADPARRVV